MSSITELKDVLKGALDFIGKEEDKKAPEVSKMNEEGNLYSLFGAPFLMSDDIYTLTEKEFTHINRLEKKGRETTHVSSVDDYILEDPEMKGLKAFCQKWIDKYFYDVLCIEKDINFYITQSWCNFLNEHVDHHLHAHPNSIITGVFYVQTDGTPIEFYRGDILGSFPFHLSFSENNEWNSDSVHFNSETGKVTLFPSKLQHSVGINHSRDTRISITFNTFVEGELGKRDAYTRLVLGRGR